MLPSEFYERTKVNLTGEEYADVERLYDIVQMDKDQFCAEWAMIKDFQLIKEIAEGVKGLVAEHDRREKELSDKFVATQKKAVAIEKDGEKRAKELNLRFEEFAKRIVRANAQDERELLIQDVIEEELGYHFIIKTKFEAGIPLSNEEIAYMVGKL